MEKNREENIKEDVIIILALVRVDCSSIIDRIEFTE